MTDEHVDPLSVWGRADILQIRLMLHLGRLSDSILSIHYSITAIDQNRDKIAQHMSSQGQSMLDNERIWKDPDSPLTAVKRDEIREQFHKLNQQKVGQHLQILLNQGVVLMCSVLDIYFNHVLDVILRAEPRTLLALNPESQISLQEFLKQGGYDENLNEIRQKELSKFDHESVETKFKKFRKLGITDDAVFDTSNMLDEAKEEVGRFDMDRLSRVYKSRHDIVHRGDVPFNDWKVVEGSRVTFFL